MKKNKQKQKDVVKAKKVDIVLEKEHYHKGDLCVKGETIAVTLLQAEKLEENRIGFRVKVSESSEDSQG